MMKSKGFGLNMWSALTYEAIKLICSNFVDDTKLFQGGPNNYTSGRDVYRRMQPMLDYWEAALRATGGALAHEKSYWTLIDFRWDGKTNAWRYRRQSHTPGDLTLPLGPNRTPTPIPRLEASEACEFLGAMTRPDGNQSNQFRFLLSKAKKWADAIRTKHISKHDGWYCLNNTILKTLEYPLMATTMTRKQCKALMTPILKAGLPSHKSNAACPAQSFTDLWLFKVLIFITSTPPKPSNTSKHS